MQVKESWEVLVGGEKLEDERLREKIMKLASVDLQRYNNDIQAVLSELTKIYKELGYTENDLVREIKYIVDALRDGYSLTVTVSVSVPRFPGVGRSKNVLYDAYIYYVYDTYHKVRNEQGFALKQKVEPLYSLIQLQKENANLRQRLEEAQQTIQRLEKRIKELEGFEEDP